MSLLSDQENETGDAKAQLWEMIPWFVNGTLSAAEARAVERQIETDPAFAAEVEAQSALAVGLCQIEEPDTSDAMAKSWERLRAQVEADEAARVSSREVNPWWARWLPNLQGGLAMAGAVGAVALVAIFATGPQEPAGVDDGFRTLTREAASGVPVIKFQSSAGLDLAALERILAEHDLVLLGDPSSGGVFRAEATEGADLEALAAGLMSDPGIVFAAPE